MGVKWTDLQERVDELHILMNDALGQNWDKEFRKGLVQAYHRIVDVREDLRI